MTNAKLEEMIAKLNDMPIFNSGVQLRHYRAAVAHYETMLRKKYGRYDYWRAMLRSEYVILCSLRNALLIKESYVMGFYSLVNKVEKERDKAFADALNEMTLAL